MSKEKLNYSEEVGKVIEDCNDWDCKSAGIREAFDRGIDFQKRKEKDKDYKNTTGDHRSADSDYKQTTQETWNEQKIIGISMYLSNGFTCPEIAKKMKIHRVTVQRYKSELKRRFNEKTNTDGNK